MPGRFCVYAVLCCLCAAGGSAQEWYVHPDGSPTPDGSAANPFATIRQAMDAAANADTVILMPGTYSGVGNYDLNMSGKSLTFRSTEPLNWDIVAATVIDPQDGGGVFVFANTPDPITLEGLTIQNAVKIDPPYGEPHGAAVFCDGVTINIRYCVFRRCRASLGGALYLGQTQADVSNCIFAGNEGWDGGALISDLNSDVSVAHCTFAGNTAIFQGGAAACEFDSTLAVTCSIFRGGRLVEVHGSGRELFASDGSIISVDCSCIEGGPLGTAYNGTSFILLGDGILDTDPLFAAYDRQLSPLLWDLHLKSMFGRWDTAAQVWVVDTATSSCIDAAAPAADYSLEPWPNGRRANLGAYGNTAQASLFGNVADLNLDGRVDLLDVSPLSALWLDGPVDYEDFDASGIIDLGDVLIVAENWLWQLP